MLQYAKVANAAAESSEDLNRWTIQAEKKNSTYFKLESDAVVESSPAEELHSVVVHTKEVECCQEGMCSGEVLWFRVFGIFWIHLLESIHTGTQSPYVVSRRPEEPPVSSRQPAPRLEHELDNLHKQGATIAYDGPSFDGH